MIWLPYAFVSMAEVFGYAATTSPSFFMMAAAAMLTKISVCVDPIIYFGFNPQVECVLYYEVIQCDHLQPCKKFLIITCARINYRG